MPEAPSVLFRNVGTLISGDVSRPVLDETSVYVEGGLIQAIGEERPAEIVVDVRGASLTPGLWDAHHHPYFGEYTPRAEAYGTISRLVKAGTTCLLSAGAAHQPGMYLPSETLPNVQAHSKAGGLKPETARDGLGTKALAIVTTASWKRCRPLGLKCYAETVIAEPGLSAEDFAEMREAGVKRLKFLRPLPRIRECEQYVQWAHDEEMVVMTHTGGRKLIAESADIGESLRILRPDAAMHVNGGPTPPPVEDADWLIDETSCTVDLVLNGNLRVAAHAMDRLLERGEPERVVIGTDSPSASGVAPWGVIRMIGFLAQVSKASPEQLLCMASGNTARAFGLPGGRIAVGQPADLAVWDAVDGSVTTSMLECLAYGDKPVPGLVMIDGEIRMQGDPKMIDARRMPVVTRTPVSPEKEPS